MLLDWRRIFSNDKKEGPTALVVPYKCDKREYILLDSLNDKEKIIEFLKETNCTGKPGENRIFPLKGDQYDYIALFAINDEEDSVECSVLEGAAKLYSCLKDYGVKNVKISEGIYSDMVIRGLMLKGFKYDFLKKEKEDPLVILSGATDKFNDDIEKTKAQLFSIFLQETPANYLTPTLFCEYAREYLKDNQNIKINAYDEEFMKEKGMNMLLSVGQGSIQPSKLLVIEYKGKNTEEFDVGLVGKGVTFDSGGISLKPSLGMKDMKKDMGGASVVLSSIGYTAMKKESINVVCVIPLVENLPSDKATKPGDVFKAMNGKTVDVTNTDAEGRLILGDALCFAQEIYNPKYLMDFATLTGAIIVALGSTYSGVFSNSNELFEKIQKASDISKDEIWRMPLDNLTRRKLKGDASDLLNHIKFGSGSVLAAVFLEEFVKKETKWAHFDIAGMMEGPQLSGVYGDYAQGRPTVLLCELMSLLSKE
ncbi:Cytosol aminopeptidase [Spraguea lophii 42_110]|uniref:Cytosol aminopeptidase n=1 Tax=Spraguea lophii (strain 42_110) TaxID=1358809 RepID=S7XPV2_SPRLO|nr:Cytosol aminopeptidase [Spraguea lophii 42_110]